MPVCPNGSAPQPGAPAFYTFDSSYISAKFGVEASLFTAIAMGLPSSPQHTADLCAVGPPIDLPTTQDYLLLATPPLALLNGTYNRFGNQLRADMWGDLCQCNAPLTTTCGTDNTFSGDVIRIGASSGAIFYAVKIPARATGASVVFTTHDRTLGSTVFVSTDGAASGVPPSSAQLAHATLSPGVPQTLNSSFTRGQYAYLQFWCQSTSGTYESQIDWDCAFTGCDTSGPIPYTPPPLPPPPSGYPSGPSFTCGSSQDVCTALATIASQVTNIAQLVTLIQRNAVPFAYVPGPTHAGLSGDGTLTIPSCVGVRVALTTVPSNVGLADGSPLEVWGAGWVSWGNTDGYLGREFLSHNPYLSFPSHAEQWTRLGYHLEPGVVASIQELYAET